MVDKLTKVGYFIYIQWRCVYQSKKRLLFLLLGIIIAGLIAPILAIASPDEKVLKYNIKMASLSLTFINGYASKNILNQIDIDNRNSTRY